MKEKKSYLGNVLERFTHHRLALVGSIFLFLEILTVVIFPVVFHLDPITSDFSVFESGSVKGHILGTDDLGRDIFARLVYGGRISLAVGFFSTAISLIIGTPLGLIAGYYRGTAEFIIMRAAEIFLAVPSMILILVVVSITGNSVVMLTIIIGVMGWPGFARLIYGNVLSTREKEYVEAAKAIGETDFSMILRYIFPNTLTPILIQFTFHVASAILQESSLSFLGLGVQAPAASWGNILHDAQSIAVLATKPWRWIPAGVILILTISAINFIGDGLRDALDVTKNV